MLFVIYLLTYTQTNLRAVLLYGYRLVKKLIFKAKTCFAFFSTTVFYLSSVRATKISPPFCVLEHWGRF